MAVSLPTAADVRRSREQAARAAAERAEAARTPLLAVLGAGDLAVTTVTKAVTRVRTRAAAQAEDVQHRVAALPRRLTTEELRRTAADLRAQAEDAYVDFAERGERAWGRIRKQPRVRRALVTIETCTEKLDVRVDGLVDGAHDAAEKALTTVARQTRSTGEKVARSTQRFAAETAETVADVATDVSEAGADAAEAITEAGDDAAHATRSTTRKAANRTAPRPAPKPPVGKPAADRTSEGDGTGPKTSS